ncbi:MFS transporter [Candidatus Peregrinibacteria bacterium]|nr:MAG: MFS transporter [Candidatus Peregrinibacteria bacterium]
MKKGIKILLVSDGWVNLALGMIGPIYAIFVEEIGGDILDASWAFSTYMFTAGIIMYLLSKWEDKAKHKEKFVVAGYALTSLGCLMYFFVHNQATLLLTQAVLGLSVAILSPSFDAIYSHYVKASEEASNWGIWEALSYIATAIAAIIGGYIANSFGFKTLFVVMFIVSLFGTIQSFALYRGKKYLNAE